LSDPAGIGGSLNMYLENNGFDAKQVANLMEKDGWL
jgi:hypothetical protein